MKIQLIFVMGLIGCLFPVCESMQQSPLIDYKQESDCDLWADRDKECINNPRFMWSSCLGSCLNYADDAHENCERWAVEGECTENPNYIHLHCPRSCALAIAWNPWVRRHFDIDPIKPDPSLGEDELKSASNLFAAAEIMHGRLAKFLNGLSSVVTGLSSFAPSEYHGMLGLAEGFLYTLRLYEAILSALDSSEEIRSAHLSKIGHILQVLKSGYSSDRIMLQLPSWLRFIENSREIVLEEIHRSLNNNSGSSSSFSSVDREVLFAKMNTIPALQFTSLAEYLLGETFVKESSEEYLAEQSTTVPLFAPTTTPRDGKQSEMKIPLIGLGTWQLEGPDCEEMVYQAIRLGYRLIDTAEAYRNEEEIGKAIARAIDEGVVTRSELFLATKISDPSHYGYHQVQEFVHEQLQKLQIDYVDLYLLHSPQEDLMLQNETWNGLQTLVQAGSIKALGLSNFDSKALSSFYQMLESSSLLAPPVILQNKLDVYHVGKQLDIRGDTIIAFAREKKIRMMAYSPFSAYPFVLKPVDDPIVSFIAMKYSFQLQKKVTAAQIVLKWIIQRGMTVIPRSHQMARLEENLGAYELPNLSREYMQLMDCLQYLVASPVSVPVLPLTA